MFLQRPDGLHSVGDNALISGLGQGPMGAYTEKMHYKLYSYTDDVIPCGKHLLDK